MRWLLALLPLCLAACDQPRASDGYRFGEPEFERNQVAVTVVQYDSRRAFERAARDLGIAKPDRLAAFGTVGETEPRCTIHVMRISSNYQPEWLGHELAHCIHGRWHS